MVTEEMLEKAKRDYPIGTIYIPLSNSGSKEFTKRTAYRKPRELNSGIDVGFGYIYYHNKWAEIVKPIETIHELWI